MLTFRCLSGSLKGSYRLEEYLNLEGFLEKSLKIKSNFPVLMSPLSQSSISEVEF